MKFHGTLDELKGAVQQIARAGEWTGDEKKYEFRSKRGEILCWWPRTGSVSIQGQLQEQFKTDLARALGAAEQFQLSQKEQRRIFIVHGSDSEALDQLQLVLYKLGLQPLVQKDVDGKGMSLLEALMTNIRSESDFAIVMLTPDDYGYRKDQSETDRQPRARQDVILEAGMALARLGPDKVALIKKGALELPSDLEGIIRLEYNAHVKEIAAKIAQRLTGAGIPVSEANVIDASQ
jgi:predicted nucleotide-binding protein